MTSGSTDHVDGMLVAIKGVDVATHLVLDGLTAAGAGGHLNGEQVEQVVDLFAALASKAIVAFHEAKGVEITHDSIMALLPANPDPLPPPDNGTAPTQFPPDPAKDPEPADPAKDPEPADPAAPTP